MAPHDEDDVERYRYLSRPESSTKDLTPASATVLDNNNREGYYKHNKPETKDYLEQEELDLETIAVGIYNSYVLQTSREALTLHSFYSSIKMIHDALKVEFKAMPIKVQYCLASEDYSMIFQDGNSTFDHLEQLLTHKSDLKSEEQQLLTDDVKHYILPRFNNHKLEPWSHVTYTIDGFAHVHLSYENFTPVQLFKIIPPGSLYKKLSAFYNLSDGKRSIKKTFKGGVYGGALGGAIGGYLGSFSISYALLASFVGGAVNLGRDFMKNPVNCTTVDCELVIKSSISKDDRAALTEHLEGFIQTLNDECGFHYKRNSAIAAQMREYMKEKAAEAKKWR